MAEGQDKESRTEEATDKRMSDARGEGNIPISQEATNFAYLLAALLVISVLGQVFLTNFAELLMGLLTNAGSIRLESAGDLGMVFDVVGRNAALMTAPIILCFSAAGVLASVLQTPPLPIFKRVTPELSRLSLATGWKRIFSANGSFEFLKLTLRLIIVAATSGAVLMLLWNEFANSIWSDPAAILRLSQKSVTLLLTSLAVLSFCLLIFDLPVTHVLWRRQLRMAPQEVKDERKQSEGDPLIKARRRSIARSRARQRMLHAVPRATLVIANPTHFAVALRYVRSEGGAPRVVAKGQDLVALSIRRIAEENDIPVIEDKALARSLYAKVSVDQMIPVEFYKAVAAILLRLQAGRNRSGPVRA
ncbi:flagellar type III secretion system protein FlhB [Hyphomicrobium sp.]|uniref:EscU/YscU/HrcU family type III secretion system export apparatus switch protein n=1 Tax=Hyphomicrobium sp. TaxID=82 RepID=UPI001DB412CC|nr:flagellar type III secretion system protein FlhB [Hyphomicrobium sp.]MBY0562050.1 flagellar type III secretion system protein FlhB [Hyphomicrobium sp.]